jgi:tetratricopeptide (TPR) repeat protein
MLVAVMGMAAVAFGQDRRDWPRIMVIFDERLDGQPSDGRVVAARIEELFLEKGFRLVDKSQFENVTVRDIALAEGNPARAKEIGMRYGAELIIVGKASAMMEGEKEFYGVKSIEYASKGDAKVIITDTGELIAVSAKNSKKSASGRSTAGTLAFQALAEAMAPDLYVKTRLKILDESKSTRIVQIALLGIDAKLLSALERSLPADMTRIESLRLRYMEKDGAVYEATIVGSLDDLRSELAQRDDLVIIGVTGTRIDLSTKENVERAKGSSVATSPLEITDLVVENIFPSQVNYYAYNPLATITIENSSKTAVKNVKVSILLPGYMSLPSEQIVPSVDAGAKQSFKLAATLDAKQLFDLNANTAAQVKVELTYVAGNQPQTRSLVKPVTIYSRNTISWRRGESVGAFVTEADEAVVNFSRFVVGSLSGNEKLQSKLPRNMVNAMAVWNGIRAHGIAYVSDPWKQAEGDILDLIQYPRETLASKTGDCDDSSVLLAACLENIGVRTKFLATNDHIFIMFDTDLVAKNGFMVSQNEKDYVIHEGTVWVPLETTMITKPFMEAWKTGAEEYYANASGGEGKLEIIDTRKAQAAFPPANLPAGKPVSTPPADRIATLAVQDLADYEYQQSQYVGQQAANLAADTSPAGKNKAAIFQAKAGEYDAAIALLQGLNTPEALNTLGNVHMLRNELPVAQEQFQKSLALSDADGGVYMNFGLARYLSGSTEDAVESFQVAMSKFETPEKALEVLGLDKIQQALGMRGAQQGTRQVSKNELFDLLNQSLKSLPDKKQTSTQAYRVRAKYKNEQNRFVFGGRRGADPTQIASIKEYLYWKE